MPKEKRKKLKHHKIIKAVERAGKLVMLAREEVDCVWPEELQSREKRELVNALGLMVAGLSDNANMLRALSED